MVRQEKFKVDNAAANVLTYWSFGMIEESRIKALGHSGKKG